MNWIPIIDGITAADENELIGVIEPLLKDKSNAQEVAMDIVLSTKLESPMEGMAEWVESEPDIIALTKFVAPPEDKPELSQILADKREPIDTELAKVAVGGLLDGLEDHFSIDPESGFLVMRSDNLPTLQQADVLFERTMGIMRSADLLAEFGQWQIGALYDMFENRFGDEFDASNIPGCKDSAYNTVATALGTFRAFKNKRYQLSFTHHREAHYCAFDDEDEERSVMHKLMSYSEYFQLTCLQQRKLFSYYKKYGGEVLEEHMVDVGWNYDPDEADVIRAEDPDAILTKEDLVDRIDVKDERKSYTFDYEGSRYHYKGFISALPQGALRIIRTDDWVQISPDGRETSIPKWERPGDKTK